MRAFATGKLAIGQDESAGTTGLSLTINCPERQSLELRRLDVWTVVNAGLNLNVLGLRKYSIERLNSEGTVISAATSPLASYGLKGARDTLEVIRIDAVNDVVNLRDTSLRVSFDGKATFEAQTMLVQYECIDADQAPYVRY